MITKTFITKSNTIFKDSKLNYGLNPISMLSYGNKVSRTLIYFDIDKLISLYKDGTYPDILKMKHILKMTNCGYISPEKHAQSVPSDDYNGEKDRATSFNVILFKVPRKWDEGIGFDADGDIWVSGRATISYNGSNWFQSQNGNSWDEEGIYSTDTLKEEFSKFGEGDDSVIIGYQHFDAGNENLEIDVTDYVNSLILSEVEHKKTSDITNVLFGDDDFTGDTYQRVENNGLCLAFSPAYENTSTKYTQYVGFFNGHTNTFFEPYIETSYDLIIDDDRYRFYGGKENKLYFFVNIGGEMTDLDELPICTIDDVAYDVYHPTKGCYYIKAKFDTTDEEELQYDVWSNIILNGNKMTDVEMSFTILPSTNYFSIGNFTPSHKKLSPTIVGINDDEKLDQGEKIIASVYFKEPYTSSDYELVENCQYRIYIKDGNKEYDVYPWQNISTFGKENTFLINTGEMLPQEYHIDIKANYGIEELSFKDEKRFKIVSNKTNDKY